LTSIYITVFKVALKLVRVWVTLKSNQQIFWMKDISLLK